MSLEVEPIPLPKSAKNSKIKGANICSECYANIFLCAKKNSGKTSAVFKILQECVGKNTAIIAIVSTLYKDDSWAYIQSYFEEREVPFTGHTSIHDENGNDQIQLLVAQLQERAELDAELKESTGSNSLHEINQQLYTVATSEKKSKKKKVRAPEYIIVLDDLSSELKSRSLLSLLKHNRHYKTKVIISSQYVHDLLPESRKQIDIWLLFKGQPENKLKTIYEDAGIDITFDTFLRLYHHATSAPYSFLYMNTRTDDFRMNFNRRLGNKNNDML
jgi:isoleucyl-tRNA synthetase